MMQSDEAVSPVIGVILMVAITVILAAFIAVLLFGMSGEVSAQSLVAVSAKQDGNDILVTYHGGPDYGEVRWINISVTEMGGAVPAGLASISPVTGSNNGYSGGDDISVADGYARYENPRTGLYVWFKGAGTTGNERVIVTAVFGGVGREQVILDQVIG